MAKIPLGIKFALTPSSPSLPIITSLMKYYGNLVLICKQNKDSTGRGCVGNSAQDEGIPYGLTVDAEGCIRCAQWYGRQVDRCKRSEYTFHDFTKCWLNKLTMPC